MDNTQQTKELRQLAADQVFQEFNFGVEVSEAEGWDTSDSADFHRVVYGEIGGRFALHVRFGGDSTTPSDIYAYDIATGNEIGAYPEN
ncbi:MAG: hypothetical protein ITG07_02375 [Candidimonas sp.]|nr:hypothetical protein [Candidimonas sp.]